MATKMNRVKLPAHTDNYSTPSNVTMYFTPRDVNGRLGREIELGDVSDISVNPETTYFDKKSMRYGIQTTVKSVVAEEGGSIDFTLDELVGKNLEMLFQSQTVTSGMTTVRQSPRVSLGTMSNPVAATVLGAEQAVDGGNAYGAVQYPDLENIVVRSLDGSTTYDDTNDYAFTQAIQGVSASVVWTIITTTYASPDTIVIAELDGTTTTLTAGVEFATGLSTVGALAAAIAQAITANSTSFYAVADDDEVSIFTRDFVALTTNPITVTGDLDDDVDDQGVFAGGVVPVPASIARTASSAIPVGAEVKVDYTFDAESCCYTIQDGLVLEGQLILQILSKGGPRYIYTLNKVGIRRNGAIAVTPGETMKAGITAMIYTDGQGQRGSVCMLKSFTSFSADGNCNAV